MAENEAETVRRSTNHVTNIADKLQGRYDAENDIIPGAPRVTATDFDLLYGLINLCTAVVAMQEEIAALQKENLALKGGIV